LLPRKLIQFLDISTDQAKEKYMFVSGDIIVPKYFFLLGESYADPLFDFGQFLSKCVSRANRIVVNFAVPSVVIFLLNNNFIPQLLNSRYI
jgi:hypothetical protein